MGSLPGNEALDRGVVDHLAATAVGRERLGHEHRQRLGRGKPPLTMRGQQGHDLVKQFRPRQQVEETARIGVAGVIKDALPQGGVLVRMHGGWLSGRSVGFGKFQPITLGSQPQVFQSVELNLVPFGMKLLVDKAETILPA